MTEMTNSVIHIHKVPQSRDTTDKNIQQTLICALGHHDLAPTHINININKMGAKHQKA